jgi:RNA-directed DNA polymerase
VFFEAVSHDRLVRFVAHRIGDPRVIRLIRKWLKAGVMEDGVVTATETGTPQGAVVSPLLANIYLHYVFDLWAQRWRRRHAQGTVILVRYADDLVAGFEHQADAERFQDALRTRLAQFGLTLHPDKSRLIQFGRHAAAERKRAGLPKPETFNFLGFTHICGRSRRGGFRLVRKTRRERKRARLKEVQAELRRRRHEAIPSQGRWLRHVVMGYFAYHAVPTNLRALTAFRHHVKRLWLRALRRRGQKDGSTWERMARVADRWLPTPRLLHPWPGQRFAAKQPRWEPDAGLPHVRIWCSEASCHSSG